MKEVIKATQHEPAATAGLDLLRALADYPHRAVHINQQRTRSRVVQIQRDQFGNVIGSIERIEESEQSDLDGEWLD